MSLIFCLNSSGEFGSMFCSDIDCVEYICPEKDMSGNVACDGKKPPATELDDGNGKVCEPVGIMMSSLPS